MDDHVGEEDDDDEETSKIIEAAWRRAGNPGSPPRLNLTILNEEEAADETPAKNTTLPSSGLITPPQNPPQNPPQHPTQNHRSQVNARVLKSPQPPGILHESDRPYPFLLMADISAAKTHLGNKLKQTDESGAVLMIEELNRYLSEDHNFEDLKLLVSSKTGEFLILPELLSILEDQINFESNKTIPSRQWAEESSSSAQNRLLDIQQRLLGELKYLVSEIKLKQKDGVPLNQIVKFLLG